MVPSCLPLRKYVRAGTVTQFLGKPEDDSGLQEFLAELKPYLEINSAKYLKGYDFPSLGFAIHYDGSVGGVAAIAFHIQTEAVRGGSFAPYNQPLPFGILTSDNRETVQSKLGIAPLNSTPAEGYSKAKQCNPCDIRPTWWDKYYLPPLKISVIFNSPTDSMGLFGLAYAPFFDLSKEERQERIAQWKDRNRQNQSRKGHRHHRKR